MNDPRECRYCGLPVFATGPEPAYCCFGCRFAAGVTGASGAQAETRWTATVLGLSVFCTINVVMLTMALWSYAAVPRSDFELRLADFLRWGALLFTAPVLLLLGRPLAMQAVDQLRRGLWSTDLLLLTGVVAATAVSVVSTVQGTGHVYYEVACVILVLVTLGRWLEATGRLQATSALDDLEQLLPETVCRIDLAGETEVIPRTALIVGDLIRIRPGERIPCDGRLHRGRTVVDEQFFTGESVPIEKHPGDNVLGGCLNLDGDIVVAVTAAATGGALGRLVDAVRQARLRKGAFQKLADTWSHHFFPLIAAISAGTFAVHTWRSGWEAGLLTALSVVLIACPCALALATPLAIWTALATAARRGVLFRSGEAVERLAAVRAIQWDKTGTLTSGTPQVAGLLCEDAHDVDTVRELAAQLTAGSTHIYSAAISRWLDPQPAGDAVETVPGRGLRLDHPTLGPVGLGSSSLMTECGLELGPVLADRVRENAQVATVFIGWQHRVRGVFVLEESLRPEARAALAACEHLHLHQAVLTGDRQPRARHWQTLLQLPVVGELLPEQKLAAIRAAHDRFGFVGMVGDGLNDAPALAAADIGIAMGCGADVTRESADVCLISNNLHLVPWAIGWSRRTVATVRRNLLWSFGYNGIGVVLAACGWLHPAVAAVLMVASSLMVLGNSLRLREADPAEMSPERFTELTSTMSPHSVTGSLS